MVFGIIPVAFGVGEGAETRAPKRQPDTNSNKMIKNDG